MRFFHGTLREVQAGCDKVLVNMIRAKGAACGGKLYRRCPPPNDMIIVANATDADLAAVPLFGRINGKLQKKKGLTTSYAIPKQRTDDPTKYYAPVPSNPSFTKGVTCAIMEYNPSWCHLKEGEI